MPNFIALGICFLFESKFLWNEETDTCFNLECVLLGRNFDFLHGYYLLPNGYYWLLLFTGGYCSLLLVPTSSMNEILGVNVNRVTGFEIIANILLAALKMKYH